jgi:hypothetical protein
MFLDVHAVTVSCHNPEELDLNLHRHENLKSRIPGGYLAFFRVHSRFRVRW